MVIYQDLFPFLKFLTGFLQSFYFTPVEAFDPFTIDFVQEFVYFLPQVFFLFSAVKGNLDVVAASCVSRSFRWTSDSSQNLVFFR